MVSCGTVGFFPLPKPPPEQPCPALPLFKRPLEPPPGCGNSKGVLCEPFHVVPRVYSFLIRWLSGASPSPFPGLQGVIRGKPPGKNLWGPCAVTVAERRKADRGWGGGDRRGRPGETRPAEGNFKGARASSRQKHRLEATRAQGQKEAADRRTPFDLLFIYLFGGYVSPGQPGAACIDSSRLS